MANGVYCKHCVHEPECYSAMKKHGIVTYVEGLVDCNGYQEVEYVAITRCKDCKHYLNSNEKCELIDTRLHFYETGKAWTADCFCTWAERRTDNA